MDQTTAPDSLGVNQGLLGGEGSGESSFDDVVRLPAIEALLDALNAGGIRYCHWKSNFRLEFALCGEDDLDILVDRRDASAFQAVLASCDFRRVIDSAKGNHPSIEQFYAVDASTQRLFHVDAYYRIVTGETLVKDYHLPLERMLLEDRRYRGKVPIPSPAAELVSLVVRLMIKFDSPYVLLPSARKRFLETAAREIDTLWTPEVGEEVRNLLQANLPEIDVRLWEACLAELQNQRPGPRLHALARRMRRSIGRFRRLGSAQAFALKLSAFRRTFMHRARGSDRTKRLATGGAVIAFVGPEATGKSTLARSMVDWLGKALDARTLHLGKPRPTFLTAIPNLTLPYFRKLAKGHRTDHVTVSDGSGGESVSLLFAIRCLMLAWDRYSSAVMAHREAANGCLVFCDRYPSTKHGAADSARLPHVGGNGLKARAFQLEQLLYRRIPQPDLVIELSVPPHIAVERNRTRVKAGKESDARVLERHATGLVPEFPTRTVRISTEGDLAQTLERVKATVWQEI